MEEDMVLRMVEDEDKQAAVEEKEDAYVSLKSSRRNRRRRHEVIKEEEKVDDDNEEAGPLDNETETKLGEGKLLADDELIIVRGNQESPGSNGPALNDYHQNATSSNDHIINGNCNGDGGDTQAQQQQPYPYATTATMLVEHEAPPPPTVINNGRRSENDVVLVTTEIISSTNGLERPGTAINNNNDVNNGPILTTSSTAGTQDVITILDGNYDLERVLEEQEIYDLICPNCDSCITKRVILRRRVRTIPAQPQPQPEPEPEPEPQQFLYKCLSCFTIFIPSGLWTFINRNKNEKDPQVTTEPGPPTLPSPPDDPIPMVEENPRGDQSEQPILPKPSPIQPQLKPPSPSGWWPLFNGNKKVQVPVHVEETAAIPKREDPDATTKGQDLEKPNIQMPGRSDAGPSYAPPTIPTSPDPKVVEKPKEDEPHQSLPETGGTLPDPVKPPLLGESTEDETDVTTDNIDKSGNKQVVIPIPGPGYPRGNQVLPTPATPRDRTPPELEPLLQGQAPAYSAAGVARRITGVEIIKCIVYGALVESIASLCVVTSAAAAGSSTLNIVALGLANMIGGLVILAHNLRVIKQDPRSELYLESLGHPGHFSLHATIAVISYIFLGLLPPVVYGFSFLHSDARDYKIIAVAASSLLCITSLSLGKAYAKSQPYLKTISYYLIMGIAASGISYAAGDLLDLLLQKLGWFSSGTSSFNSRLASY